MKYALALIVIGIAILAYSFSLKPYKDEKLFNERYMALTVGQSEKYWKIRDEMLTSKYKVQDYGGTLVAIGIGIWALFASGQPKAPKKRIALIGLAVSLPFLTAGAFVFDLFQGMARQEFPPWADSLGIPLMGVPVQVAVLLLWAIAHLDLAKPSTLEAPLKLIFSRKANWWLLLISGITGALLVLCLADGAYWYAVPGALWLYFYTSLAARQRAANGTSN